MDSPHTGLWFRKRTTSGRRYFPFLTWLICFYAAFAFAQKNTVSNVWVSDTGDGRYRNPVLFADYSDPDVTRVGDTFYLVASSFDQVPGLPLLESKDLVNWRLIGHALQEQSPPEVYAHTRHGAGVWAPSIRYHKHRFFIFYPDPDYGIYMTQARSITGPWTTPKLIQAAKGWIDPCPLWDDDGNAYLVNAVAASRSGLKNQLIVSRMSPDGDRLLDSGTLVVDGHGTDVTLEGPKLYKRHGYYYIFAPAGGVKPGYQLVFRSRSVYGPYERRVVLAQGKTPINGPHQGAWVTTRAGENWFVHFQDRNAYGRVVLLEPMRWEADWPLIGVDQDQNGLGQPVLSHRKPAVRHQLVATPPDSDEFNGARLGEQWQWQANPQAGWALPSQALGVLRLFNVSAEGTDGPRLWTLPNVLSQKSPGPAFTASTKLTAFNFGEGDRAGLVLLGKNYDYLAVERRAGNLILVKGSCEKAEEDGIEKETTVAPLPSATVFLRVLVQEGGRSSFEYSVDGENFSPAGKPFEAAAGVWIGAKLGLFAEGRKTSGERGYVDVDWFRLAK